MENTKAIEIINLSYKYPTREDPTIKNISLTVYAGEVLLVVGPTGSGKSTLGLCLNGLIPHILGGDFQGKLIVDGVDTSQSTVGELSARIGLLFQDPDSQLCNLFGYDELAFGCENLGLPPDEIKKRIDWISSILSIKEYLFVPVQYLSVGLKQRIALASILAMQPKILVLDEPTSNLDSYTIGKLVEVLGTIRKEIGVTVIIIEHDVDSFIELADRVVVLENGKIVGDGNPSEVFLGQIKQLIEIGVKIPEICNLIDGIWRKGVDNHYHKKLNVPDVCEYIASQNFLIQNLSENNKNIVESNKYIPNTLVDNLSVSFSNMQNILEGINLEISPGEAIALVGPNGSGKTTLIKTIAGLRKPTTGNVYIDGTNVSFMNNKEKAKKISFVFQEPDHQFIKDIVRQDLELALVGSSANVLNARYKVDETLRHLNLTEYENSFVYQLSMGQRRILSVATSLTPGKSLLLIDEPTIGLDSNFVIQLTEMLKKQKEGRLAIILITHDMKFAAQICDRIVALSKSNVIFDGSMENFFDSSKLLAISNIIPPLAWTISTRLRGMCDFNIKPSLSNAQLLEQLNF